MKEHEIKKAMIKLLQVQFDENDENWITSPAPQLNGYLVYCEERFGLVDDEMEDVLLLPKFIRNGNDFSTFEKALAETYQQAFDAGKKEKQIEISKVLGLVTEHKHEHLKSEVIKLQEKWD